GSLRTDAAVVEEVLEAIEPGGIEAALKASEQAELEDQERRRCVELALGRARYEAKRAEGPFDAVEQENRLVGDGVGGGGERGLRQRSGEWRLSWKGAGTGLWPRWLNWRVGCKS